MIAASDSNPGLNFEPNFSVDVFMHFIHSALTASFEQMLFPKAWLQLANHFTNSNLTVLIENHFWSAVRINAEAAQRIEYDRSANAKGLVNEQQRIHRVTIVHLRHFFKVVIIIVANFVPNFHPRLEVELNSSENHVHKGQRLPCIVCLRSISISSVCFSAKQIMKLSYLVDNKNTYLLSCIAYMLSSTAIAADYFIAFKQQQRDTHSNHPSHCVTDPIIEMRKYGNALII